ncbi:MAG: sodium:solute symporter, partial [Bacteroidetes bacterium]|nr:sodium:solute symporter [Bacteroidota bacterium]
FALIFLACVFFFREADNGSLIQTLLVVAGYTYGPLLALFSFGILTRRKVREAFVPAICMISPIACYVLKAHDKTWFGGYVIGTELLIINALLAFLLLWFTSFKEKQLL